MPALPVRPPGRSPSAAIGLAGMDRPAIIAGSGPDVMGPPALGCPPSLGKRRGGRHSGNAKERYAEEDGPDAVVARRFRRRLLRAGNVERPRGIERRTWEKGWGGSGIREPNADSAVRSKGLHENTIRGLPPPFSSGANRQGPGGVGSADFILCPARGGGGHCGAGKGPGRKASTDAWNPESETSEKESGADGSACLHRG